MENLAPDGAGVFCLPDVLDLRAASGLHADLLAARGRDLVLDASSVQRLGGQCLQVLLAAVTAWGLDGHSLSFASPSEAFVQALDLFGVAPDAALHKEPCA